MFAALKRKETYATSGTRIKIRFFSGDKISSLNLVIKGGALFENSIEERDPISHKIRIDINFPIFLMKHELDIILID